MVGRFKRVNQDELMTISAGSAGLFGPKRRRMFDHRQRTENMPEPRSSGGFWHRRSDGTIVGV
jgi:hypothetical protein